MSLNLTLTYDDLGIRRAAEGLTALGANLQSEVMAPIGAMMESTTLERFDTNVGPDGEPWDPSLRAKLFGGRTLVDKGHLRDSIHYSVEDDAVEIGSAHVSAAVHQFGATIHAKTGAGLSFTLAGGLHVTVDTVQIPERPFLGVSAEDETLIRELGEAALSRAFDASVG